MLRYNEARFHVAQRDELGKVFAVEVSVPREMRLRTPAQVAAGTAEILRLQRDVRHVGYHNRNLTITLGKPHTEDDVEGLIEDTLQGAEFSCVRTEAEMAAAATRKTEMKRMKKRPWRRGPIRW